jgi:hypothetical protein
MKAIPPKFWMSVIFLMIIFFIAPSDLNAQSNNPCKCPDVPDLINEFNKANAALDEIQRQEKMIKGNYRVRDFTLGSHPALQAIKDAMSLAEDKNAKNASGWTDGVTCQAKVNAKSDCLESLIEQREAITEEYCKAFFKSKPPGTSDHADMYYMLDIQSYLKEQKEAYSSEVKAILKLLYELRKTCPLNDWFGTISYTRTMQNEYFNKTSSGQEQKSIDTRTINGTIRFTGVSGEPFSTWEVGGKHLETAESQGMRPCTGGLATAKNEGHYEKKYRQELDVTGAEALKTTVNIGEPEEGSKIGIGFKVPEIKVKLSGQTTSSDKSGCPQPNGDSESTTPRNDETRFDSQNVNFTGDFFIGNPEKISGSVTINNLPPIKNDKITMSDTTVITYRLYRLKGGRN